MLAALATSVVSISILADRGRRSCSRGDTVRSRLVDAQKAFR